MLSQWATYTYFLGPEPFTIRQALVSRDLSRGVPYANMHYLTRGQNSQLESSVCGTQIVS
jgi:hypothetical protein